ncbi:MAG: tRNA epoxyqueuosine(34) reductase QueG [Thermoguttaceae bacterium]|nr:tRNA epoxyqueuosine(34) reductase QueG [Thermoguttaceae bacterium]MDW8038523.1 tRNA epoxyqueuosine(34) reductase QueG [Thermoguttaceae bacterium]
MGGQKHSPLAVRLEANGTMEHGKLTEALKAEARQLGFDLVGVCPAGPPPHLKAFQQWLQAGYAGQMHYFHRRVLAYEHPRFLLKGVRSLVMLGMNYRTVEPQATATGQGRISRYAWGSDYHELIRRRLRRLAQWLVQQVPEAKVRGVVDTAPLLERSFAQQAGLGWIGKNTVLIHPRLGSYLFLAGLLTTVELVYDEPFDRQHCGRCQACLDACPTGALVAPYVLDARRCISYLTIELRQMPPQELRLKMGDWLFGCDRCQEVCPWNRPPVVLEERGRYESGKVSQNWESWNHLPVVSEEAAFYPGPGCNPANAVEILGLTEDQFRERFRGSPLWRAKRAGILRNAALVLGNRPSEQGLAALCQALQDKDPMVRAACAWALGRYPDPKARYALQHALTAERVEQVRQEIQNSLQDLLC